jgi:hypothetical protein
MHLRGKVFVFTSRNGVQIWRQLYSHELLIQTLQEPLADAAVKSSHADAADENAIGISANVNGLLVSEIPRLETTTSLNKL